MATQVPGAGDAAAPFNASEAAARMSADPAPAVESPSTATETSQPAPEQTQVASPATEQAAPAPTPETTQDPSKWLLDKFGGDLAKASQWAAETNNRAAEMAKTLKANGIDPQTLQPLPREQAPPELPAQPEVPVQIPEEQVVQTVKNYLSRDTDAKQIASTWNQNSTRIEAIGSQEFKVKTEIDRELMRLEIPEIAQDSFRASEVKDHVRELKAELFELKNERRDLMTDNKGLEQRHREIADYYKNGVKEYLTKEETKRLDGIRYEQASQYHEHQFAQAWPQALDAAIKANNIPPALVDDFKAAAKTYAQAVVNLDGEPGFIEDVPTFVANVGKTFMGNADKYHRIQSGVYGSLATARGLVPGPNGSAAVAPPSQPTVPETVNDIVRNARSRLAGEWRATFGG